MSYPHRAAEPAPAPSPSIALESLEARHLLAVVNGLTGTYFNNANLTAQALQRVDATVNFDWGSRSPAASIDPETFSVRWTGFVKPAYSEEYTFYAKVDDGVRVWVNDKLIIDKWYTHSTQEFSGKISLTGGQKYAIRVDYFENTGVAGIELRWSSKSQAKQIIPTSRLFLS